MVPPACMVALMFASLVCLPIRSQVACRAVGLSRHHCGA